MAAEEEEHRWWGRGGSRKERGTMTLVVIGICDGFVDFGSFEV